MSWSSDKGPTSQYMERILASELGAWGTQKHQVLFFKYTFYCLEKRRKKFPLSQKFLWLSFSFSSVNDAIKQF